MWEQISLEEAVKILVSGGKVDEGFHRWAGTLKLRHPQRWQKARWRKALTRQLAHTQADGWWIIRRKG